MLRSATLGWLDGVGEPVCWGTITHLLFRDSASSSLRKLLDVLVDPAAQVPSWTQVCACVRVCVCTCECAFVENESQGPCRPAAAPCPALITTSLCSARAPSGLRHVSAPAPGLLPASSACPGPAESPAGCGRSACLPAPPSGPASHSHLLQLLTPTQAGQPLNPVVRQLPGDRRGR